MSSGATSGDRQQQARNNVASRRQSGLEARPEDLRDAALDVRPLHAAGTSERAKTVEEGSTDTEFDADDE